MWINQMWLDELGPKMPETTEDFRAVLKASKNPGPQRQRQG
jgi:putative aldouronate transport system substrate-binding protein